MSIELQKLDYIIVYVSNMQRSTAFYRDVLGLPLKFTSPGWTEFTTGTTTIALHMAGGQTAQAQGESQQSTAPAGQAQLGFMVDDVQSVYEALKEQDVHFMLPPTQQRPGVKLAVFADPDGLGITIQQR